MKNLAVLFCIVVSFKQRNVILLNVYCFITYNAGKCLLKILKKWLGIRGLYLTDY